MQPSSTSSDREQSTKVATRSYFTDFVLVSFVNLELFAVRICLWGGQLGNFMDRAVENCVESLTQLSKLQRATGWIIVAHDRTAIFSSWYTGWESVSRQVHKLRAQLKRLVLIVETYEAKVESTVEFAPVCASAIYSTD